MSVVRLSYYTDPACPWSWALEPALRKLLVRLEGSIQVDYVMSGIAREFGDPVNQIEQQLDAAERSGMPVDPRLWLESPPRSSHPACIAVKAAAEQGDPSRYLRRLREGFQARRRKLDTRDALLNEARGLLDIERFTIDLGSHAILEAFAADLGRAATVPQVPTVEFGNGTQLHGVPSYEQLRDAAITAGARVTADPLSIDEALRRFETLATPEVAALCELPGPRAPAELWRLASEWQVKAERLGVGELWSAS